MENLDLIDWRTVGFGSLWITGLAVLLTAFGFADYEANSQGLRTRHVLRRAGYQAAVDLGLALFCLGLLGSAKAWWERGIWVLLALYFGYATRQSWRAARGGQREEPLEYAGGIGIANPQERLAAESIDAGSSASGSGAPRVNVLGVGVSAINLEAAVETILGWLGENRQEYVCLAPVHAVMECYRSSELTRIYNRSGLTTPDGMPIVWLLRAKGHSTVGRVYGPDLMLALIRRSSSAGHRHYFYGGTPEVLDRLVLKLRGQFPDLCIVGSHAPPVRPLTAEEDCAAVEAVNAAEPDILWVALGSPKQERWMAAHRDWIRAPVMVGVGAAFDFLSGAKPQAPLWIQRSGLEWLFRVLTEPRRLWRRYLVDSPFFVALMLAQQLGWRREEDVM